MKPHEAKEKLKALAIDKGARLFGVCRLDNPDKLCHFEIRETARRLNTAVSIGVPVSPAVLESITNRPNMLYKSHYQQINHLLNDIAFLVASEIIEMGYESVPIPASKIIKWKPLKAHLSHREVAYKAGLGWHGRNNLLVNEKYGSKVRLVTILTDLELPPDNPVTADCGDCCACVEACPAGAIDMEKDNFDLNACYKLVSEFARPENIGSYICGLCLQVCYPEKS